MTNNGPTKDAIPKYKLPSAMGLTSVVESNPEQISNNGGPSPGVDISALNQTTGDANVVFSVSSSPQNSVNEIGVNESTTGKRGCGTLDMVGNVTGPSPNAVAYEVKLHQNQIDKRQQELQSKRDASRSSKWRWTTTRTGTSGESKKTNRGMATAIAIVMIVLQFVAAFELRDMVSHNNDACIALNDGSAVTCVDNGCEWDGGCRMPSQGFFQSLSTAFIVAASLHIIFSCCEPCCAVLIANAEESALVASSLCLVICGGLVNLITIIASALFLFQRPTDMTSSMFYSLDDLKAINIALFVVSLSSGTCCCCCIVVMLPAAAIFAKK